MYGAELEAYRRFGAPVHMGKGTRFRFTEKHMLPKAVDNVPGMGDDPFPWQPIRRTKSRRIMTDETENETDAIL